MTRDDDEGAPPTSHDVAATFFGSEVSVNPEVTGAVLTALAAAARAGSVDCDDAHLMAELMRVGSVARTIEATGADLPRLRNAMAAWITTRPRKPWWVPRLGTLASLRAQRHVGAIAKASGLAELTGPFALASLIAVTKESGAVETLRHAGLSLLELRRQIAHGPVAEAPPSGGRVRVILHNDPFTTMELVTDILRTVFDLDDATAHATMLRVHTNGLADLGVMDAQAAASKIERVKQRAEAEEMPLRLSWAEVR